MLGDLVTCFLLVSSLCHSVSPPCQLTQIDVDKPGLGQFYCITCAYVRLWEESKRTQKIVSCLPSAYLGVIAICYRRHFINGKVLAQHNKTKPHKRKCVVVVLLAISLLSSTTCGVHLPFVLFS